MREFRLPFRAAMMRRAAALIVFGLLPTPALAQYIGTAPPPPLPAAPLPGQIETPAAALARAVRTLAQSPRDFNALILAGRSAVELGDTQTAIGFFGRAEDVRPSDPAPKIGMGAATVASGDASGALSWFYQAQQLGATGAAIGADRGLAQDLLGNQAAAQVDYRAALGGRDSDEARRRLALSLAISGNRYGAFAVLQPLLMRRDPAAQRVRAFVLALVGDERGASTAIDTAMPGSGSRMASFFRLLPRLSATQKAAAVHLGVFPDPSQIRLATVAPQIVAAPAPERASRGSRRSIRSAEVPPPAPAVAVAAARPAYKPAPRIVVVDPVPRASTSLFDFKRPAIRAPRAAPVAQTRPPAPDRSIAAPVASPVQPGFSPAPSAALAKPVPNPPPPPAAEPLKFDLPSARATELPTSSPPQPTAQADFTATVPDAPSAAAITPVSSDRLSGIDRLLAQADELPVPPAPRPRFEQPAKPAVVDVTRTKKAADLKQAADTKTATAAKKAAEAKQAADAKKSAEAKQAADAKKAAAEKTARDAIGVPGTNWVQLAGGAHADRMAIEFRRLGAKSALLRKRGGAVTGGKDYFRLLTGPFTSKEEAQAFVNQLAKDGVDGFSWTRAPATLRIEKIAPK